MLLSWQEIFTFVDALLILSTDNPTIFVLSYGTKIGGSLTKIMSSPPRQLAFSGNLMRGEEYSLCFGLIYYFSCYFCSTGRSNSPGYHYSWITGYVVEGC